MKEKFTLIRAIALTGLWLTSLFITLSSSAQLPAFPGAEGYGKYTTGGRGSAAVPTTVFEVTNLNDDNSPGSLRYAVSNGGSSLARTVVFRVSGTIHLTSQLTIRSNTTIAGQTAPGGGICLADKPVVISGDNVILRYVRIRMGDRYQNLGMVDGSGGDDALGNLGGKKIIIDHCSISWSSDEALTIYRGDSITLQWNIISEPLNYSYHFEAGGSDYQEHGYGGIWGSKNGSFHHNLVMHLKGRAPRFSGNSTYPAGVIEKNDFRNNIIYNWIDYSTNGGEGGNYNVVNNYYKYGPSTNSGNTSGVPKKGMIMNPSKSAELPYGKIYLDGNYVDGYPDITAANWKGMAMADGSLADTGLSKVTTPFEAEPIPMQSAQDAYNLVLLRAGAILPARDTMDERLVNDVKNRTGRVIDVQGGYPHGTPYAQTVNAWPALASGTAPADTDHDGMPDAWETANGLNPNDATDRNGVAANGYTNLENYLNSLADSPVLSVNGTLNSFHQNIPSASAVQQYTVAGFNLTNDLVITPPASYQVSADDGATWFNQSSPLHITQSGGLIAKTVKVRLNASSPGNYNGSIEHSSTGTQPVLLSAAGTAILSPAPPGTALIVAKDGSGDYTTVQAAINAAPTGLTAPYIIFIRNGKYKEKITVPSNKPFIQLVGESVANTILYYDDGASTPLPGGGTVGTQNSASFTVNANDFSAFNITFANTFGDGSQAVAVLVNADRAVFKNCRLLGNQDTLYTKGGGTPRHYFKNCYIDGNVDFIFGSSVAVFDSTVVYAKSRTSSGSSYITAANTPAGQTYGYVFRDCQLPNNTGTTTYYLGRPWQNGTGSSPFANNKTVFLNSRMSASIRPEGWSAWDAGTNTSLIYYGEYASKRFDGTPVDIAQRVAWSYQLTPTEADNYTLANMFGSWDPCLLPGGACTSQPRDIAIANFNGTKTASASVFNWNISWPVSQVNYSLYRSATRETGYTKIGEVTAANDTSINFQLTDALPAAGTSWYYYLVGSLTGMASHISDTIEISSIPTIQSSGVLQPFTQNLGTPSAPQTISISGQNLVGNVSIVPPASFEISADGGTTWIANPSAVTLSHSNNTLAATTISIRLNAAAIGSYSGNIQSSSTGATTVNIAVSGNTAIIPVSNAGVLLHWPFTMNNADSANVRAEGVAASTPAFMNFYSSNGTTVATIPAYSPTFGQAFSGSTSGDGLWTTAGGGPGGTLRRNFYEEFTVKPNSGYKVRVDSIYVTSAFYASSSNTRLAVVYSLSNFVADSSDVFTIPGGFVNPVTLANQTGGPTNIYALSVAGLTGVTVNPGQTLSFRLYFSCGSTSTGRYATLKDVKVIGEAIEDMPVSGTLQHWPFTTNNADSVNVRSAGVTASTPSFTNLYTSNGTTVATIPAYSPTFGQAFGATANGDGSWGTAAGGPGGTLRRTYYEQFNVTAATGYSVKVDSIYVTGAFYNTSSNTRLAAVYSLSNFVSDSTDVFTVPGGFVNPVTLANQTNGPANTYALSVAGTSGITLQPGQTISFRLYFSCGSSSPGRYAMLKDVKVTGSAVVSGAVPVVTVNGTLNNFSQIIGTPSAVQTYTVAGNNLTSDITITPPAGYQVSADGGTTWFDQTQLLKLTPVSGEVTAKTISVRLNAASLGVATGDITHTSSGAVTKSISVNGSTLPVPVPVITTTGTLSAFSQTVGTPSAVQTYTVSGTGLSGDVSITPSAGFQVSANGTNWFSETNPLILAASGGTVATTTISVRLNATASGAYTGNIVNSSAGATSQTVSVNGTVIDAPVIDLTTTLNAFTQTVGSPSAIQTYPLSAAHLTGNITITPPVGYEITRNGTDWFTNASPMTVIAVNGSIEPLPMAISVRLNAQATGTYAGAIVHTSAGAATKEMVVSGTVVNIPVLQSAAALNEFSQTAGTPSVDQSITIQGQYLQGAITITPPVDYEVSLNNVAWFTNSSPLVIIPPASGAVNATTVRIRLNASAIGAHGGTINVQSAGATSQSITVAGHTYPNLTIGPNPAGSTLNLYHARLYTVAFISIININGVKLGTWQTQPFTSNTQINISTLPAGVYTLEYRLLNERVLVRFVKQ